MKTDPCEDCTRRTFINSLVGGLAAMGIIGVLEPSVAAGETSQDSVLTVVRVDQHQELQRPGGFVTVKDTAAGDLIVIRSGDAEYSALSVVCPHAQCNIKVKSAFLIQCPCHQSGYKTDGSYISGPAKRGLRKFPIHIEGEQITVLMGPTS